MFELIIHTADGDLRVPFTGTPLLYDLISGQPDAPGRPCGGRGSCGGCAVMAQGCLSAATDISAKVLSCQTRVIGDAEVWLPRRMLLTQIETRTIAASAPFSLFQANTARLST